MNLTEYTDKIRELIGKKFELKNESNNLYNKGWKLMNKSRFAGNMAARKDKEIIKLVSDFKDIKYINKQGKSLLKEEKV